MSATVQGALFAIAMLAMNVVIDHDAWGRAIPAAGVAGVLFGVFMWFVSKRVQRNARDILAGMTGEQRGAVVRAAATGAPPADMELRVASAALARSRLADYEGRRTLCVLVFAAFAVVGLVGAIAASPWYLLVTGLFAAFGVWAGRYPTTLRRRLSSRHRQLNPIRRRPTRAVRLLDLATWRNVAAVEDRYPTSSRLWRITGRDGYVRPISWKPAVANIDRSATGTNPVRGISAHSSGQTGRMTGR